MRSESPTTRNGPLMTAGATALMTLVAIAATVSAAPPAAQIGCNAVMMEQSGMRGVAAVVAATAWELFSGEQHVSAGSAIAAEDSAPSQPLVLQPRVVRLEPERHLAEHLLNLPPPAC